MQTNAVNEARQYGECWLFVLIPDGVEQSFLFLSSKLQKFLVR